MAGEVKARLGLLSRDLSVGDLIFPLNPDVVRWSQTPRYAENSAAGADYGAHNRRVPTYLPSEWVTNRPEKMQVETLLAHEAGTYASVDLIPDVEDEIQILNHLMKKSPRTGKPPLLIFSIGRYSETVIITDKQIDAKLWTPSGRILQARLSLQLEAQR